MWRCLYCPALSNLYVFLIVAWMLQFGPHDYPYLIQILLGPPFIEPNRYLIISYIRLSNLSRPIYSH